MDSEDNTMHMFNKDSVNTKSSTEISKKFDESDQTDIMDENEQNSMDTGSKQCFIEIEVPSINNVGTLQSHIKESCSQHERNETCSSEIEIKGSCSQNEMKESSCSLDEMKESFCPQDEKTKLIGNSVCHSEILNHNKNDSNKPVVEEMEIPDPKEIFFTKESQPQWYEVKGNYVTPEMITGNLPKVFESLPVDGRPASKEELEDFQMSKIKEFVGCNLEDEEFNELAKYCSPVHLKIGKELIMTTNVPMVGYIPATIDTDDLIDDPDIDTNAQELRTVTKCRLRERDIEFRKKLKYRGVRLIGLSQEEEWEAEDDVSTVSNVPEEPDEPLEPGKDILYRVRVYRPFAYSAASERNIKIRHSVFSCDIVVLGRDTLTALRDRIVCHNEVDMRVDVSNTPEDLPMTTAKEMFPSGFLFINNVFYVDTRAGCADHSAGLRRWARRRGLGVFPRRDMGAVRLRQLQLRLGHPEVFVHQGNCEHLFTFSEIRLLGPTDPLTPSNYPCHTAISQHQSIYCTTCAEFSAKWVVIGCNRVPFDPAFFCDTCFKLYLYKDGEKIGEFKAYSYRGNEMNMLKPLV